MHKQEYIKIIVAKTYLLNLLNPIAVKMNTNGVIKIKYLPVNAITFAFAAHKKIPNVNVIIPKITVFSFSLSLKLFIKPVNITINGMNISAIV